MCCVEVIRYYYINIVIIKIDSAQLILFNWNVNNVGPAAAAATDQADKVRVNYQEFK